MIGNLSRGMILAFGFCVLATVAQAQQYAAFVMDARNGRVIHSRNADTKLHPASLTKMMTLYIIFDDVRRGRLSLDQKITISANAAAEPPSRLGLRAGQKIELRYLIRAAAIKSANDASTALAEASAGSEAAFAERMNQYARAMGMTNTTFRNAHGLTRAGHLSTARDMATLGRRLFYDFPQYYNIFGRNSTSAGIATVQNTNRRLLDAYDGADGIKTGYTRAAGFNLVSSAQRGERRVIVALLGGKSSATRNAEVARLMDLGLKEMPARARLEPPAPLRIGATAVAANQNSAPSGSTAAVGQRAAGAGALLASGRPRARASGAAIAVARSSDNIAAVIAEVNEELAAGQAERRAPLLGGIVGRPTPRPGEGGESAPEISAASAQASAGSTFVVAPPAPPPAREEVVASNTAVGTTGGADWGVQLGSFRSQGDAERHLLTTALKDVPELNGGLRRVEAAQLQGVTIFRAQFVGLSRESAQSACVTLARQQADCITLIPGI